MNERDFTTATYEERNDCVVRPNEDIPLTEIVKGSYSHLIFGKNAIISFLTMKAGSTFELHSHPEEQIMIVTSGYCDEVIKDKMYRVTEGDVIHLASNLKHGAFVRDVDCKAIDIFVPPRDDYRKMYNEQHPETPVRFLNHEEAH